MSLFTLVGKKVVNQCFKNWNQKLKVTKDNRELRTPLITSSVQKLSGGDKNMLIDIYKIYLPRHIYLLIPTYTNKHRLSTSSLNFKRISTITVLTVSGLFIDCDRRPMFNGEGNQDPIQTEMLSVLMS